MADPPIPAIPPLCVEPHTIESAPYAKPRARLTTTDPTARASGPANRTADRAAHVTDTATSDIAVSAHVPPRSNPSTAQPAVKARQDVEKRSRPKGLTPRVRKAIEFMVFHGFKRSDAATEARITDNALRMAFRKPEVLQHWREQMDVLRTSAQPRAFHEITRLADDAENERTRLEAAKYVDGQEFEVRRHQRGMQVTVNVGQPPGYMVDVTAHQGDAAQILRQSGSVANVLEAKEVVPTEGVGTREGEADAEG